MATKLSSKDLIPETSYEPAFSCRLGITDETTSVKDGSLGLTHYPPKSKSRPHYHTNGDLMWYCISGKTIYYIGKEKKEYLLEPGDFIYVPQGEIHYNINPSETEPCEGIGGYTRCSNPFKSGKVLVDLE